MPAYTDADDTPGVPSTIGITCCTTASVRARLVPGGIVTRDRNVVLVLRGDEAARRVEHAPAGEHEQARVEHAQQRAAAQQLRP